MSVLGNLHCHAHNRRNILFNATPVNVSTLCFLIAVSKSKECGGSRGQSWHSTRLTGVLNSESAMPFSLKPHQLVAQWVPGSVLLVIIFLFARQDGMRHVMQLEQIGGTAIVLLGAVTGGFVAGLLLDAIRDILEWGLCMVSAWKIDWGYIMRAETEKLQRFEDYYFTYYVFSFNLFIALVIAEIIEHYSAITIPCSLGWAVALIQLFALANGITLRVEIVRIASGTTLNAPEAR